MKVADRKIVVSDAIKALSEKLTSSTGRRDLHKPSDTVDYLRLLIGDQKVETSVVLYLDARFRLLGTDTKVGTVDECVFQPRPILMKAFDLCARYMIIAHNHPSGDCTPSNNDVNATKRIAELMANFDVELLDHFVIGRAPGFPCWSISHGGEVDKLCSTI